MRFGSIPASFPNDTKAYRWGIVASLTKAGRVKSVRLASTRRQYAEADGVVDYASFTDHVFVDPASVSLDVAKMAGPVHLISRLLHDDDALTMIEGMYALRPWVGGISLEQARSMFLAAGGRRSKKTS